MSGGRASAPVPPAAEEDPDILALSRSLNNFLKFAKALEEQGVLTLERLKKMPVDKAQKVLEKVKMTEIQIEAIMEAIASAPVPAPTSAAAHAPRPASASEKVFHSQPYSNFALCPNSRVLQAAAAARIVGKDDVTIAAMKGNIELVKDHVVADAGCVHKADE
jgi:hypothetical protein